MINDVIDGISIKLHETFGDDYTIYSENVDQDFNEPCFFIDVLNPIVRPYVGNRHLRIHPFDIRFFPIENNDRITQICNVADELIQCLEYITVNGDLVRGINMSYTVVDDVLHFLIEYNIIAYYEQNVEMMEDLTIDQLSKG